MKSEETKAPITATLPTRRAADYKVIYANGARTAVTPWDVRVTFSLTGEAEDHSVHNEDQLAVVISPQLAKIFYDLWKTAIDTYENSYGEIPRIANALNIEATSQQDKSEAKTVKGKTKS